MSTTTATPPAAAAATKGARDILLLVLHLRWKSVRRRRTAANFCPAVVPGREARKGERGCGGEPARRGRRGPRLS